MFVFGYGSLLHPASVRRTLPDFNGGFGELIPARLCGYRRGFSALVDNRAGAVRPDGSPPRFIAYMNVQPDPAGKALGVLIGVTEVGLAELDRRETVYERLDVTDAIETHASVSGRVFTYVSTPPIPREQFTGQAGIRQDYVDLIAAASEQLGPAHVRDYQKVLAAFADVPRLDASATDQANRYRV